MVCQNCGKHISLQPNEVKRGLGTYCSPGCREEARIKRGTYVCLECEKTFYAKFTGRGRKYCSVECSYAGMSKTKTGLLSGVGKAARVECICKFCGNQFSVPPNKATNGRGLYCSKNCMEADKRGRPVENVCKFCGKVFETSCWETTVFCGQECYTKGHHNPSPLKHRGGKRKDLGDIWFRSSWEANYARLLNHFKDWQFIKDWEFEPHTFKLEDCRYLPDFRVESLNGHVAYHEVKGYMTEEGQRKLDGMAETHPDVDLLLVDADRYKFLEGACADKIPHWEFKGDSINA